MNDGLFFYIFPFYGFSFEEQGSGVFGWECQSMEVLQ